MTDPKLLNKLIPSLKMYTEYIPFRFTLAHYNRSINTIRIKGIVHFEGIQDVGVFVSAVFSILIFLGQTVSCLSVI